MENINNKKLEKRTEITKEPRIGSGHPNLDPALIDPNKKNNNK